MKLFSSKKRVTAIGVVTAATLVGGGMAYAYWTTTGGGKGNATTGVAQAFDVTVVKDSGGAMAPGNGEAQVFTVTVANRDDAGVQRLNSVAAQVAESATQSWENVVGLLSCTEADFSVTTVDPSGGSLALPVSIDPGEAWTGTVSIEMINRDANQDACKNLTNVPLFAQAS